MRNILNSIRSKWHPLFYLRKNKIWKKILQKYDPDFTLKICGIHTSIKLLRDLSLVFPHDGLEQKSIAYFRKTLEEQSIDVFFDIGANIGTYSWNALEVGVGDIYLFEPDTTNQRLVSKTISYNKIKNAFLFPMALGKDAELDLFLIDEVSGATGTLKMQNNPESIQRAYNLTDYRKVPVFPLDAFINFAAGKRTLIKIDAEGAEDLILAGGRNFIQAIRPFIFIECFNRNELNKFCELNYEIYDLKENFNYYLKPK